MIPTDTVYGLVASALLPLAVEKLYTLKNRAHEKPCIVLISSLEDLSLFDISLSQKLQSVLSQYWPGPVSIALPCTSEKLAYLRRGKESLAFRLPKNETLVQLLKESGPLAAPSANPEGLPPATTVGEARGYFGDSVDFYIDGGTLGGPPSKLISIDKDANVLVIRA